ncbi:uncharacterized protein TNIN_279691 [Trichonephila inaurata madagascariensis]|uniref:Uncharacterized protein n=1 Tax=Trichonephila inaurata madagascariensis TaxID=2747483 RepID=A0A8X6XEG1_9ARAC|nr:uncharacterized protein TNIN_279691 [Trichonephila inaurata madagascariensis]
MVGCFQRHAHAAHDRNEGVWLPAFAKPSCGWHLRQRTQSTCSSPVAPQIQATQSLQKKFWFLALLERPVSCTPMTNEPVSLRSRCKRLKVFRFGKRLERKSFIVQSPGLQGIPYHNAVNEIYIGHFLVSVAGNSYSHQKRKHDECGQPELL